MNTKVAYIIKLKQNTKIETTIFEMKIKKNGNSATTEIANYIFDLLIDSLYAVSALSLANL